MTNVTQAKETMVPVKDMEDVKRPPRAVLAPRGSYATSLERVWRPAESDADMNWLDRITLVRQQAPNGEVRYRAAAFCKPSFVIRGTIEVSLVAKGFAKYRIGLIREGDFGAFPSELPHEWDLLTMGISLP